MVLSNKKLKQKLRAARAELIVRSGTQDNLHDKDSENSKALIAKTSSSLSTLLDVDAQRPRLSKREKRRLNAQQGKSEIIGNGEISNGTDGKNRDELKSNKLEAKKRKRKRDDSKVSDNVKEESTIQSKKKKKRRKDKKTKKKVGNGQVKADRVEDGGSGPSGQKLVAEADERTNRDDVMVADKVYVGGIPYYSSEDDIRSYFESCGTITDVDCMKFPDTGKFRGIAIITFKTEAAAKRALALDGSDMGGLFLKIQPFKSSKPNTTSNFSPSVLEGYNRIYIGNLSWDITEDDLKKLFSDCSISSIRFGEDKETGEFKGYAHVDFADSLSLKKALKLDQSVVCGRPVKISCAVPKKEAISKFKSAPISNRVESSKISTQDDSSKASTVAENQVNADTSSNAVGSKIRRRTCYDCGEKGHLSSACPKKVVDSSKLSTEVDSNKASTVAEDEVNADAANAYGNANAVNSKIRRRTCYECGEKGHLSSDCPKKVVDNSKVGTLVDESKVSTVIEDQVNDNGANTYSNANANSNASAISSKIRRRTCYECGEKGHLSSACPKRVASDSTVPSSV